MVGAQETNGWSPGNKWQGHRKAIAGAQEPMLVPRKAIAEALGSNGWWPGKQWLGPREAMAGAMSQIILDLDYTNFKNSVAENQGYKIASIYSKLWETLYK